MKNNSSSPLDNISVATPCRASWENMQGSDKARFCQTCRKNVYNLSTMSRAEAEALIQEKEGRLCVRFYQRDDGTVLTADCPVGLGALRRRLWGGLAAGFAACVAFGLALLGIGGTASRHSSGLQNFPPVKTILNWINPPPPPVRVGRAVIMGAVAVRPQTQPPQPIMGDVAVSTPSQSAD